MTYRIFYSVDEVAKIWNCDRNKVREYCQNKTIRAYRVEGEWQIDAQGLDEYELRTTGRVPFYQICMYCKQQYGIKYELPPKEWNGKEEILTHGVCDKCKSKSDRRTVDRGSLYSS